MAQLSQAAFYAKWVPLLADNVFQDIDGPRLEALLADLRDSALWGNQPNVPTWDAATVYSIGFVVRYSQAGGQESFYYALKAGLLPHPTYNQSDANWKLVPGPVSEMLFYQYLTLDEAQAIESDTVVPGRRYKVVGRWNGSASDLTVYLDGLEGWFRKRGTLFNDNATQQEVDVNVLAGTFELVGGVGLPTGTYTAQQAGQQTISVPAGGTVVVLGIVGPDGTLAFLPSGSWSQSGATLTVLASAGVAAGDELEYIYLLGGLGGGAGGSGGGGATQYVQLATEQGKRVAFLTLPQALTVTAAQLVDNASAVNFQVNQKISGNWQPGVQESAAAITTRLAALTAADYQAGVELELETLAQSVNSPLAALLPLTGSWLSGGLVPLVGTRGTRRVYNPATSPQPSAGLLFNDSTQSGLPAQYLRVPTPALSLACVTFWLKRSTPWSGYECLLTLRPYSNRYVFMQDNPNGSDLVVYANGQQQGAAPANGTPYGQWVRVVVNLENVPAGFLTLFAFTDGNAVLHDVEVYDLRYYSRKYTAAELADVTAGPTDSLVARYELPMNTTGNTVPDLSGNGNTGQLTGF